VSFLCPLCPQYQANEAMNYVYMNSLKNNSLAAIMQIYFPMWHVKYAVVHNILQGPVVYEARLA
jgi:hypothetical protein